jgi:hypothetical protein
MYMAAVLSIGASIAVWAKRSQDDPAHGERFGIFVGLWAPTFMLLGHGLQELETEHGFANPTLERTARRVEAEASKVGSR